jgi:hypothetical protein
MYIIRKSTYIYIHVLYAYYQKLSRLCSVFTRHILQKVSPQVRVTGSTMKWLQIEQCNRPPNAAPPIELVLLCSSPSDMILLRQILICEVIKFIKYRGINNHPWDNENTKKIWSNSETYVWEKHVYTELSNKYNNGKLNWEWKRDFLAWVGWERGQASEPQTRHTDWYKFCHESLQYLYCRVEYSK